MSLSLVSHGSEHLIKSHSSCKGCLEMKGDSVQVYFVNLTRFLCMYMCGWGVHVGIHVCVRESHMCMDARGQPQLSVLDAMHFIF